MGWTMHAVGPRVRRTWGTRVAGRPCAGERARVARQRDALAVRTYERHIRDAHGARTPCARRETRAHVAGTEQSGERARWLQWLGVGTERSRAIAYSDRPFRARNGNGLQLRLSVNPQHKPLLHQTFLSYSRIPAPQPHFPLYIRPPILQGRVFHCPLFRPRPPQLCNPPVSVAREYKPPRPIQLLLGSLSMRCLVLTEATHG